MCCTLVPRIPPHIRFPVRSARVFASGFLSAPLAGIQLPFATLRRYLPGVGLCSLNCASFPLSCFQLQRFQKTGTLAERTDKQPGIPGTQQSAAPLPSAPAGPSEGAR